MTSRALKVIATLGVNKLISACGWAVFAVNLHELNFDAKHLGAA